MPLHLFPRTIVKSFLNKPARLPPTPPIKRSFTTPPPSLQKQDLETFTQPNGHTISFSTCGPLNAPALFYFHGQSGCRLQGLAFADIAHKFGLRIICPDRPGIGFSTFEPKRRLLDYPTQIASLARYLGLETFRVMGGSGGGPYVVACAYALPHRQLKGAAVVAGLGPADDPSFQSMRLGTRALFAGLQYAPRLVGALADMSIGRAARNPDPEVLRGKITRQMRYMKTMLTEEERRVFEERPETVEEIVQDLREHFRQGPQGFVRDGELGVEPWGFRLEDVGFEGVRLYYGSEDRNTPVGMGRSMAEKLKGAVLKEYEGETHMTLLENRGEDIFRDVADH